MSILASIKNVWNGGGDDDYDYDDDQLDEVEERPAPTASSSRYSASKYSSDTKYSPSYGGGDGHASRPRSLRSVPIPLRSREKNIYTLRPKNQDEAAIAADYLKSGSAVVMNLETVDHPIAVRIIDFMSGVCYGLEGQGHAMKLGDAIFLFTPTEYEIASDELDYGENRDFFFKNVNGAGGHKAPAHQPVAAGVQVPAPVAAQTQRAPVPSAVTAGMTPTVPPVRAQQVPQAATTPSGYATANYTGPAQPRSSQPAPAAQMSAPAPAAQVGIPAPTATATTTAVRMTPASTSTAPSNSTPLQGVDSARTSTLPANSVYGSGGKAHVLIGGKPATVNSPSPSSQGGTVGGSRGWDR